MKVKLNKHKGFRGSRFCLFLLYRFLLFARSPAARRKCPLWQRLDCRRKERIGEKTIRTVSTQNQKRTLMVLWI
jgi:hypothetical protein